jgi:capsular polysaccharide biosynthesis protein
MRLAGLRPRPKSLPVIDSVKTYLRDEVGEPGRFTAFKDSQEIRRRPPRHVRDEPHLALEAVETHEHPPTFCARLPGARVAGREPIVLTSDYRAVLESAFDRYQLDRNRAFTHRPSAPRAIRGERLLLTNQWAHAHFHWMLDTLPRLALLPITQTDSPILVPPRLSSAARESLRLLGVAEARLEPLVDPHVVVDELVMPSFVGKTGNPPRWALDWLTERLVGKPKSRDRRLFVSRRDARWRTVVNEDEVMGMLEPLGFEGLVASSLPLTEQLTRFAEAEIVVGPHGGALTGLLAARDATVIELFPEDYVNGCYYAVSDALGLDYWYLVSKSRRGNLLVDLEALRATLAAAGVS